LNPTLILAIATLALVAGPLFERVSRRLGPVAAIVDGATVGGIVVVALLHLLPDAGEHLGAWTLALAALGFALPVAAERALAHASRTWRLSVDALVLLLFLAHEVTESAALASRAAGDARSGVATLLVVVGHRLPLGLLLWARARERFGASISVLVLALVAAATWFGPALVPAGDAEVNAVLAAVLAGGLMHLVFEHGPSEHDHGAHHRQDERDRAAHNAWSAAGALAAAGLFVPYLLGGAAAGHEHGGADIAERLRELVLDTSVPLALGVAGAALIEAFLPARVVAWIARGSRLRQALAGVAVGTPLPVCSCGVLPIYRSLVVRGTPAAAALAFLIAAPEIGVDSILLSWSMLGPAATIARVACALALAVVIGVVVGGFVRDVGARAPALAAEEEPRRAPLAAIARALFDTWGHLAPWILFGWIATALVEPWISPEWALETPSALQVLALALAGLPAYICATAATPFAAMLLAKGFAPGAVIAFLLTGPATNVTTFGAVRRLHGRRTAVAFVLTALAATIALGLGVDFALSQLASPPGAGAAEGEHGPAAPVAAAALLGLTAWLVFRGGPRAFLSQVWRGGEPAHEHAERAAG
jgi:hypothetical protein